MLKRYYVLKPSANPLFLGEAGNICSLFYLSLYVIIISLVYNTITLKGETLCAILEISDGHCAGRSQTEIIPPPVLIPILSFLPASPSQPGCLSAGPGCCNRPLIPRIHIFIYTTVIPEKLHRICIGGDSQHHHRCWHWGNRFPQEIMNNPTFDKNPANPPLFSSFKQKVHCDSTKIAVDFLFFRQFCPLLHFTV